MSQVKKGILLLFLALSTVGNIPLHGGTTQLNQLVLAIFIFLSLFLVKRYPSKFLVFFLFTLSLILVGSLKGIGNIWLLGDLSKLLLLLGAMAAFVVVLDDMESFYFFVKYASILFILTIVFGFLMNPHLSIAEHRLVNLNISGGGGPLGWAAAVLFSLYGVVVNYIKEKRKVKNLLLFALTLIIFASLSRNAILFYIIYLIFMRRKDLWYIALLSCIFSVLLFLCLILFKFVPFSVVTANAYRFVPSGMSEMLGLPHIDWPLSGRSLIWSGFILKYIESNFTTLIFGYGIGSVSIHIPAADYFSRDPHNFFISILMTFGLLGLVSSVLFWSCSLYYFKALKNRESFSVLVALLFGLMFNSIWRFSSIIWLNALLFIFPYLWLSVKKEFYGSSNMQDSIVAPRLSMDMKDDNS